MCSLSVLNLFQKYLTLYITYNVLLLTLKNLLSEYYKRILNVEVTLICSVFVCSGWLECNA